MKYLCIHGHFYQPPRENAWLEAIEQQDSAAPFHDWNARICAECYSPNALARVLNDKKELVELTSNYARISFNFGPTLLSWMEKEEPEVYQSILEADKQSRAQFLGHGSAIAQAYNHIILPLANARDKETQVKWGIYDFEKRFGRKPEALWLAETACNTQTLEVLAAEGMKFVILAPGQCARVRKIGADKWEEVGAAVDPKRAYLCRLPSGNQIALFFYDGPISQGIAFSDTLSSGEKFAARLLSTYNDSGEDQLMHIATDGETYGHHQKFAEMALAYCLKKVAENPEVKLTVYGEFLDSHPPQYEAQIVENTSWSCFHGVERWRSNCGCNSGGHPSWNQTWRGPLRKALDFVRDALIETFEKKGSQYFKDVWDARNDYIALILDRSLDAQHRFFLKHATETAWRDRPTALMLLEMQRNTLLMYTSCGWFFDEISGLETVQIMQYAARALELNRALTGQDLEPEFIKRLEEAPSNIAELKNGACVYERYVKPQRMPVEKVAVEFVVSQLADETANPHKMYAYDILRYEPHYTEQNSRRLCYGTVALKSTVTLEENTLSFVVMLGKDFSFISAAGVLANAQDTFAEISRLFDQGNYAECAEKIRRDFAQTFLLGSLFLDIRRKVVRRAKQRMEQATTQQLAELFENQYPIVRALQAVDTPVPPLFLTVAKPVLVADLQAEFSAAETNIHEIEELMEDVKSLGLDVVADLKETVTKKITFMAFSFARNPQDTQMALRLVEFLNYLEIFNLQADTVKAQEFVFLGLRALGANAKKKDILRALARKLKIAL